MRLLLDANLSPRRIGSVLEEHGHDVLSLATDPTLGALDDPEVLALAAEDDRILVTRNARDFAPLSGRRRVAITPAASSSGPWATTSSEPSWKVWTGRSRPVPVLRSGGTSP